MRPRAVREFPTRVSFSLLTKGKREAETALPSRLQIIPRDFLKCRRARNDLDDLARDARLADAVHVERQRLNQLARVLRGGVHRRHARALLARDRLQQRAVNLRLDESRQEAAEDCRGRLLIDVLDEGLRLRRVHAFSRARLGARNGKNLLDDDALRDDGAELVEDDEDLVNALVFGEAAHHVARDFERLGVLDSPPAGESDVLADDLDAAAAEEVSAFAPDGEELDGLVRVLVDEGLRGLDEMRVEGPGQTLVRRDQHEQVAAVAARVHERVVEVFARARREVGQNLRHLHRERARGDGALLRALELRSRDHLHGLRDLLRVLHRLDAPAYVEEISHRKSDE